MTKAEQPAPPEMRLEDLRQEIDGIDRALHSLLIERGEIIDRLIAVKARQGGGSAFRPGREAEMMRRLVTRHRGILPLDTVESIWRIIISTFTYVQAPYSVHADMSGGDAPMRDSCRFHFGFTVPLATHAGASGVIAAVANAAGDLGLVRVGDVSGPWWDALAPASAPKIIARIPFVERADHAAALPLFVVAKPPDEAALQDVLLYAVTAPKDVFPKDAPPKDVLPKDVLPPPGLEIVRRVATPDDFRLLVAAPGSLARDRVAEAFSARQIAYIGSHAARFEIERSKPVAS